MKLLFLDIDGVLNKADTTERIGVGLYAGFHGLDRVLLDRFLAWQRRNREVHTVLSSTWRIAPELVDMILKSGIALTDMTRKLHNRRAEIDDYLARHTSVTHYALLDDIQQFSPEQVKRLVLTNYEIGLTDEDLAEVDRILNDVALH